ncbi:protoporphyrinogen/coproporphyrinogen oxidase, partial [Georgenia subflava]
AIRALAPPGPAVATTTGGLLQLPRALATAIEAAGAEIRTGRRVTRLRRLADGWEAEVDEGTSVRAPRLVLATPARAALDLLGGILTGTDLSLPAGSTITHVTLVVRAPALDGAPRGAGLLVAPGDPVVRAKALTHASAKWPWLAATVRPGEHVLRLSYGRPGAPAEEIGVDDALADARLLLGAEIEEVLDARVVRREGALAPATPEHRASVAELVGRTATLPGLTVTGTWVAGTGLASVVPHAHAVAGRLTR